MGSLGLLEDAGVPLAVGDEEARVLEAVVGLPIGIIAASVLLRMAFQARALLSRGLGASAVPKPFKLPAALFLLLLAAATLSYCTGD